MSTLNSRNIHRIGAVALAVVLAACQKSNDAETAMKAAKDSLEKRDYATAAVHLKNVLQGGDSREAHQLLATAHFELGQYAAAETHARRALASGAPANALVPLIAQALQATGNSKRLVEEFGRQELDDPRARADLKATLGEAYLALGQFSDATAAIGIARKDDPVSLRAQVGAARLAAATGHPAEADAMVKTVLSSNPKLVGALSLRADLLVTQGKNDEAKAAFRELVELDPRNAQSRFALISLQMATNDLVAAANGIADMRKVLPGDIRWQYLDAVLSFRNGQVGKSQESIQQVLKVVPDHSPSMLLAGAAAYSLGSYATAEDFIRRVLVAFPNSLYARNLLVATYLRRGQPAKAEDVLAPALRAAPNDPAVLRSAGEVAFANNQIAEAAAYYERALNLEKDSIATRTRLAQIRLAGGESNRAIEELEAASGLDKSQYQADLSLIAAHLNQRAFDKALRAAADLERKQPNNPLTHTVKATILVAQQDYKKARISLDHALELQFNYLPAVRILANIDLSDRKPENARARFENILAREPNNDAAHIAFADFLASTQALPRDIAAPIERAIKINPKSAAARIALVKFHTRNKDAKSALAAAQAAAEVIQDDPRITDCLGLAQMAAGESDKAIDTYKRMAAAMPDNPLPLMRLASAQYAGKQIDAPIAALRKALALRPNLLEAQRDIVAVQIAAGRTDEALKESRSVQKARPKEAVGYVLEGEVLASQKKFAEAANAYGEGVKRLADPQLVVKQHQLLLSAGNGQDAAALAAKWLKDNPRDSVFRFYQANELAQGKDYQGAATRFKELLSQQPDNLALLNNIAWVLSEAKDPSALGYAERAFQQAPTMPEVQDTYGWMLFNSGDVKRGVEMLRLAAGSSPDSPDIRLRLAKALIGSGDKAGAKRELELAARSASGTVKAEIEQLLRTL